MRNLASIQKIVDIRPIEGADAIQVAQVQGWNVVIAIKDNFHIGDLCVYIEIDSQVPSDNPVFAFLEKRKYRVRTIKLRGQISQGLILPLSILPNENWKEGDDVTSILKVVKYDSQAEQERIMADRPTGKKPKNPIVKFMMRFKWFRKWWIKRNSATSDFPTYLGISKTDETRVQNLSRDWHLFVGQEFLHTEKMDGQSGTYFIHDKTFGVCSRNIWLKKRDLSTTYWDVAEKYDIENFLKQVQKKYKAKLVVCQLEICGPSIQGNKYGLGNNTPFIFNLKIDGRSLNTSEIDVELVGTSLRTVPFLGLYTFTTIEDILNYVEGKSVINPKVEREGCVFRFRDVSFKAISNKFLLKEKD